MMKHRCTNVERDGDIQSIIPKHNYMKFILGQELLLAFITVFRVFNMHMIKRKMTGKRQILSQHNIVPRPTSRSKKRKLAADIKLLSFKKLSSQYLQLLTLCPAIFLGFGIL